MHLTVSPLTMPAMRPYSNDLRRTIVEAYDSGDFTQDEIAELFGVCNATVRNVLRRQRETGSADALPHAGGRTAMLDEAEREQVRQLARQQADATLSELCQLAQEQLQKSLSRSAMCRLLQALGLPRKKSPFTPPSATPSAFNKRAQRTGR